MKKRNDDTPYSFQVGFNTYKYPPTHLKIPSFFQKFRGENDEK